MKRMSYISIVILMLVIGIVYADTHVGGDITVDTYWDLGGSPYIVDATVRVRASAKLTIDAGVTIQFDEGTGLIIGPDEYSGQGEIEAEGFDGFPILFTGLGDSIESWKGIIFAGDADYGYSNLTYCIIENAGEINDYGVSTNIFVQDVTSGHITLDNCIIRNSSGYSFNFENSSITLSNSEVQSSGSSRMIFLDNSSPAISNCTITGNGAMYWLYSQNGECEPTISSCVFNGSAIKSVRVGTQFTMNGNSFSGATFPGTEVIGGDIDNNRTWEKQTGDSLYIVYSPDLRVRNHACLTVNPGVAVQFNSGTGLIVGPDEYIGEGALQANGNASNEIIFTSKSGLPGGWKGILFDGDSDYGTSSSSLTYCTIKNAGQSNIFGILANIHCKNTTTPSINSCRIIDPQGYAIYLENSNINLSNSKIQNSTTAFDVIKLVESSPTFNGDTLEGDGVNYWLFSDDAICNPTITNCIFRGSVTKSVRVGPEFQMSGNSFTGSSNLGTEVIGGNISCNRTWEKQTGDSLYIVYSSDLRIRNHACLTVNPGVAVQFNSGTGLIVGPDEYIGEGALQANGNASNGIIFTSKSGSTGGWRGIIFDDDSDCGTLRSSLKYCTIANAGQSNTFGIQANIHCHSTTTPLISHCRIDSSSMHGIYLENTSLSDTVRCTLIRNNGMDGIYIASSSNIVLGIDPDSANCIFGNGDYGLENRSSNNIIAINNYWGTEDLIEIEDVIYDSLDSPSYGRVIFSPWSDTCLWAHSMAVREQNVLCPCKYSISTYPNPFNSACRISAPENAIVEIFDIDGRMVDNVSVGAGLRPAMGGSKTHHYVWSPDETVGSGLYLVRVRFDEQTTTTRVVYLK